MKSKNLLLILSFFFFIKIQSQNIELINDFIEKNSSSKNNFWTHLEVSNDRLIVYNQSNKSTYKTNKPKTGLITFLIDKIDTKKIKHKKNGIILSPNQKGKYATYYFNSERKIEKILIQTNDMSKTNRKKLISLLANFITKYDKEEFKTINSSKKLKKNKVNNTIISFILNFELSQKNGEVKTIYPFISEMKEVEFEKVNSNLNLGGFTNQLELTYNDEGYLATISYSKSSSNKDNLISFKYSLIYENSFLKSINIKGNKRYVFSYNQGILDDISIYIEKTMYRYNIQYENEIAYLKLDIVENGVYNKDKFFVNEGGNGKSKDKIQWNENFYTTSYSFNIFKAKKITYDKYNNITSLIFSDVNSLNNQINFDYSFDKKNNWIKLKDTKLGLIVERNIVYKK